MQDGGPLQVYDVVVGGVKLRLRLSEADARRRGVWVEPVAVSTASVTKARRVKNKKRGIETEAAGGE